LEEKEGNVGARGREEEKGLGGGGDREDFLLTHVCGDGKLV